MPTMSRPSARCAALLLGCTVWLATPSSGRDKVEDLAPKYQKFLADCDLLLTKAERRAFLALEKDYQRDGFIQRFWDARDPYPETERNEFKTQWMGRLEEARETWRYEQDDRRRVFVLHGHPASKRETQCGLLLWPIEIWRYVESDRLPRGFVVIFVQRAGGGPFVMWRRLDGFQALQAMLQGNEDRARDSYAAFIGDVYRYCSAEARDVIAAVDAVVRQDQFAMGHLIESPPRVRDTEWLDSFHSYSTDLPTDAAQLGASLNLEFPDRDRGRTVVQGLLRFEGAAAATVGGEESFELQLTGEVLREDELFESFRYRFTVPTGAPALVFERLLRPGDYTLILRVDDLHSERKWREARVVTVPAVEAADAPPAPAVAAALDAARAALGDSTQSPATPGSEPTVRLRAASEDHDAGVIAGPQRFEATVGGSGVTAVRFVLDGEAMLTKGRPPYNVDLLLGSLPRTRTLRAVGLDAQGREIAADELVINPPPQRFRIRIVDPRPETPAEAMPPRLRAEVQVPDGSALDRVEMYRGERLLATLFQPPWTAALPQSPSGGSAEFVRAVAFLDDGLSTEDLVYLARPEYGERVDVRLVEVYASVLDSNRRPVRDLAAEDFTVREAGSPQRLVRFEAVEDLPLHVLLAIDTSASMTKSLDRVREAAQSFFNRTVRPMDRAALVTFSDRPSLRAEFTNDLELLTRALGGIAADRGTALWDSVVFAIHYMQGASGQAALILLSDGADRSSRFRFEETLEFAQRAGVAVYAIGTEIPLIDRAARGRLCRLAEETGGRCVFIDQASELDPIYAAIESELRSRYLLVYQSPATKPGVFRPIEVTVEGREVQALAGYWP
jgi:VWFA-related protein